MSKFYGEPPDRCRRSNLLDDCLAVASDGSEWIVFQSLAESPDVVGAADPLQGSAARGVRCPHSLTRRASVDRSLVRRVCRALCVIRPAMEYFQRGSKSHVPDA